MRSRIFSSLVVPALLTLSASLCVGAAAQQLPPGASATTTALTASASTLVEGQDITLTATVTSSAGTPAGSVTFYADGSVVLATVSLNGSGVAKLSAPSNGYSAGSYTLTAKYAGNSSYAASTSSGVDVTLQSPVSVAAQGIPNPVVQGQNAQLQAIVSATDGGGIPTGTVSFYVQTTKLGSATLSGGSAVVSASTSSFAPGTYPVVAKYSGDALHAAGNSPVVNVVLQAAGGTACGSGSESTLSGLYSFALTGFATGNEVPFYQVGSFVADGKGGVGGGEEDVNFSNSYVASTISTLSVYSIGEDGRGCLTLVTNNQPTHTYRFVVEGVGAYTAGVAGGARIIEFDDKDGSGMRASGGMFEANSSEFGLSHLQPNYSFILDGFAGSGNSFGRAALAGTFAVSTSGVMSDGITDYNNGGSVQGGGALSSGSISNVDGYGRGSMSFTTDGLGFGFRVYMVNKGFFFIVGTNGAGHTPIFSGKMHEADTGFTKTNVPATFVQHNSGTETNLTGFTQELALTSFSKGSYSESIFTYANGAPGGSSDSGTYTVASNGRLVLSSAHGDSTQVWYLLYKGIAPGEAAYEITANSLAVSGAADVQAVQTYSNSAVGGDYGLGHDLLINSTIVARSGFANIDASGNVAETVDLSATTGLTPSNPENLVFSFGSNGISDGGGVVAIATGSNIYYMVEDGDTNPIVNLTLQ